MPVKGYTRSVRVYDLNPNEDHIKQIKRILKSHQDLCLLTYHFSNHIVNVESDFPSGRSDDHFVAYFGLVEERTLIDRGDGIRWALS